MVILQYWLYNSHSKSSTVLPKLLTHIDIELDESNLIKINNKEKIILKSKVYNLKDNLIEEEREEFKIHLKEEMNGLTLSILIEIGNRVPDGVTNINLQKTLKKSKTTITDQTAKLVKLGYLTKQLDLSDVRKRPFILTKKGFLFLYYLSTVFSKYLNEGKNVSSLYSFEETLSSKVGV